MVALCTYAFTKTVDFFISISNEKRDFSRVRRERMLNEIEILKDEVGRFYELAANWKPHEMKEDKYKDMMLEDDQIIGKYNKYPSIVGPARDAIYWCKIVAHEERGHQDNVVESKKELRVKYTAFIEACNVLLDNAV